MTRRTKTFALELFVKKNSPKAKYFLKNFSFKQEFYGKEAVTWGSYQKFRKLDLCEERSNDQKDCFKKFAAHKNFQS